MIQFQHFASMIRSENTLGSDKTDLLCEALPRWTAHGVSNAPCVTLYRNQIQRRVCIGRAGCRPGTCHSSPPPSPALPQFTLCRIVQIKSGSHTISRCGTCSGKTAARCVQLRKKCCLFFGPEDVPLYQMPPRPCPHLLPQGLSLQLLFFRCIRDEVHRKLEEA